MSVPEDYKSETKLRQVFGDCIRRIWITTDCKELDKLVNERDRLAFNLETAETKFIRRANKARTKSVRTGESSSDTCLDSESTHPVGSHKVKRPTHRLKFLFGKKVDSIHWYRSELARVIKEVDILQRKHQAGEAKQLSAMFVEFNSQADAQVSLQTLSHHRPFHMAPRFIGISPREVVWEALNLSWWQRIVRRFTVQGGLGALVIFWSFPAALVGTISNITYLAKLIPFLKFILHLPSMVKGAIEGLLPSAALVALMSLVPIICRSMTFPSAFIISKITGSLTPLGSLRKTCRGSIIGASRTVHPERSFRLPGCAGVSSDNANICCICCHDTDYQGSSLGKGSFGAESA